MKHMTVRIKRQYSDGRNLSSQAISQEEEDFDDTFDDFGGHSKIRLVKLGTAANSNISGAQSANYAPLKEENEPLTGGETENDEDIGGGINYR